MIEVGDMVRVTDAWSKHDVYKNGDVLEVIGLSDYDSGGVWVRTEKYSGHGDCGCDRKIEEPYAYLGATEFEVVENKELSKGFAVKDFHGGKVVVENQQKIMVLDEEQLEFLNQVRAYSDKDITAAEIYIGKIIAELSPKYKVQFSEHKEDIQACHIWKTSSLNKMEYRQTCYGKIPRGREYNKTVSRMIAMYYVFGIELPEWVY